MHVAKSSLSRIGQRKKLKKRCFFPHCRNPFGFLLLFASGLFSRWRRSRKYGSTRNPARSCDCLATGVDPCGKAKLLLSRIPVSPLDRPARQEPRPPKGVAAVWGGSCGSAGTNSRPRQLLPSRSRPTVTVAGICPAKRHGNSSQPPPPPPSACVIALIAPGHCSCPRSQAAHKTAAKTARNPADSASCRPFAD